MASRARLIGNQNITVGTVELGNFFGQVMSGSLNHLVDEEDVMDALGNVQAVIQKNERKEFEMETVWDESAPDPVMGDALTLPDGNSGIINSATLRWTNGTQKAFTLAARYMVSLGNNPTRSYVDLA
jgi:hypothetical protein